jgi:transposase
MACDAAEFRSTAQAMGAIPVVPSRKNARHPQPCPAYIYRHRNLIGRCWSRLKERRAIATRYDKTAISYAAGIAIAATLDWFKSSPVTSIQMRTDPKDISGPKPNSIDRGQRGRPN